MLGALIVVAHYRGISIWQSGLGLTLVINIVFSLSVAGISIGGHLGGLVGGAICGWLIVNLGERRNMPAAALAGCAVVGVLSVVLAIAVAGGHGLTPNGVGFGAGSRTACAAGEPLELDLQGAVGGEVPAGGNSGWRIEASSSRPSTILGPGREK